MSKIQGKADGSKVLAVRSKPQVNVRLDPKRKEWLSHLRAWAAEDSEKCLRTNKGFGMWFSDKELTSESAFISKIIDRLLSELFSQIMPEKEIESIYRDLLQGIDDPWTLLDNSLKRGLWTWEEPDDPDADNIFWEMLMESALKRYKQFMDATSDKKETLQELRIEIASLKAENKSLKKSLKKISDSYSNVDEAMQEALEGIATNE